MEVRRRTAETVKQEDSDPVHESPVKSIEDLNDDQQNERIDDLVSKGMKLYNEAEESEFEQLDPLVQGLKYFVKAAEEGSHKATKQLKTFFTETPSKAKTLIQHLPKDLIAMAQTMIQGTDAERKISKVAKEMFQTMSQGANIIRKEDINEATERLINMEVSLTQTEITMSINKLKSSVKQLLHYAVTTDDTGNKIITEESFCLIACRYARGEVVLSPLETDNVELSSEQLEEFKRSNLIKKVTDFPAESVQYVRQYTLRVIERHGVRWIWSIFSMKQVYFVLLVYLLPLINIKFVLGTLATILFAGSLLSMVISTLQIVANSSKVSSFMEYSSIFLYFSTEGDTIDTKESEFKLIKRSALPYLTYAVSTILVFFSLGQSHTQLIIYELLFVVTGALSIVVFFHFQCWKSPLILLTLSTRLVGWTLMFLHIMQAWFPIPSVVFFAEWRIVSIPIFPWIYLDINLITLLQFPIQTILIAYYIYKYSWKNFFQGLGPYFLFLSWWMFNRYLFGQSSIFSLLIFIPGVISIILCMPLLPLIIFLSPIIVMFYYGMLQFLIVLGFLLLFGVVAIIVAFKYKSLKETRWLNIPLDYVVLINLVVVGLAFIAATSHYSSQHSPGELPQVKIEKYYSLCGSQNVHGNNYLKTQLNCLHLKDRVITVESGIITEIKINGIVNEQLNSLAVFPKSVQVALICLMGERKPFCGTSTKSDNDETCIFKGCHFDYRNYYSINILVDLMTDTSNKMSGELILYVSHKELMNSSLMYLENNTRISFNATLIDGIGTDRPVFKLISFVTADGIVFSSSPKQDTEETKQLLLTRAWNSFLNTLSYVFEVLCGLTPPGYYKNSY